MNATSELKRTPKHLRVAGTLDHGMQPVYDPHNRLIGYEHRLSVKNRHSETRLMLLTAGYHVSVGWRRWGWVWWLHFRTYPPEIVVDTYPSP